MIIFALPLEKELQPDCLVNARIGHGLGDYDVLGDNKMPDNVRPRILEACITLNDTWGYKAHDQNWKSADVAKCLLRRMVKIQTYCSTLARNPTDVFRLQQSTC